MVEVAAWACGEHERVSDGVLAALISLAAGSGAGEDPLVRESAVAALGAIGDDRGLDAILAAHDGPPGRAPAGRTGPRAVSRSRHPRAAEVTAALDRARTDRDWQVRQAAEDLTD